MLAGPAGPQRVLVIVDEILEALVGRHAVVHPEPVVRRIVAQKPGEPRVEPARVKNDQQ